MKFVSLLKKLKIYTMNNQLVHSVAIGDIYENLNGKLDIQYANVNFDIASSQREDNLVRYNIYAYYTDRLLEDKSNWAIVKDAAETVLTSIINYVSNHLGDVEDGYTITFFEQQFVDYCAGGYVGFILEVPNEMGGCEMDDAEFAGYTLEIYENGKYDVENYTQAVVNVIPHWGTIIGNIEDQLDLQAALNDVRYDDTEVKGLINEVDSKVENLDDFECGSIVPTTTNFVPRTVYTIHEALQRTANLFGGFQGEIDDINDLIPNQATEQNQLADKAFVNSTVTTNAANFRGNWVNWESVPTNVNQYPEDFAGNRTPTNNDYMVVQDASDYTNPEVLAHQLTVVNLHTTTKAFTIGVTDEFGSYNEYYFNNGFANTWKSISPEYSLKYQPGTSGRWSIKTNKPEDTHIVINKDVYENANNGILLVTTDDSNTPVIVGLPASAGQYQGSWRFVYVGDWATRGRLGWKIQYQIGSAFTAAQQAAIDSTITSTKVATYDGYGTDIIALQTDKLDKNYTANKIYGTDSLGAQAVYTLGNGLAFDNGQIQCTINPTIPEETVGNDVLTKTLEPNKVYIFESRTNNLTLTLGTATSGIVNEYHMFIYTGETVPRITFPSGISWVGGAAPNIIAGTKYEISILNNIAIKINV